MFFYILCALLLANSLAADNTALNDTATPAPCKDDERMTEICETTDGNITLAGYADDIKVAVTYTEEERADGQYALDTSKRKCLTT
ncbi:hypothetical protein GCK32_006933 [Trichostrongylus colubriformis]|uniref:Uncharacterized protein n=1 Tax=Trichostrongylus colubriformis TaxID=6319 RepID=A0AAN8IWZ8_TRICO